MKNVNIFRRLKGLILKPFLTPSINRIFGGNVIIIDESGRIGMSRRHDSGLLDIPGGCIELTGRIREPLPDGVVRELEEEWGIKITPDRIRMVAMLTQLVPRLSGTHLSSFGYVGVFVVHITESDKASIQPDPSEVTATFFLSREEITARRDTISLGYWRMLQYYFKWLENDDPKQCVIFGDIAKEPELKKVSSA